MEKKEFVKSRTVKVSGIPTKVFTIGANIHDPPNEIILIIPGNHFELFHYFFLET